MKKNEVNRNRDKIREIEVDIKGHRDKLRARMKQAERIRDGEIYREIGRVCEIWRENQIERIRKGDAVENWSRR